MFSTALFIFAVLLIIVPWLVRYKIKPHYAKTALQALLQQHPEGKRFQKTLRFLSTIYRGVNSGAISSRERKRLSLHEDAFVYGEIEFLSFVLILEKAKPQAGEVFYDLGSGAGKAVFTAALNNDFSKAYGIELIPGLYKLANQQISKAKTLANLSKELTATYMPRIASIQFINDNFLNVDISAGDIIFINATCLSYPTWEAILRKLSELKIGSRVIATTKKIEDEQFELLYQAREVMSWGLNLVSVYIKNS